jgi:hypothetical protein
MTKGHPAAPTSPSSGRPRPRSRSRRAGTPRPADPRMHAAGRDRGTRLDAALSHPGSTAAVGGVDLDPASTTRTRQITTRRGTWRWGSTCRMAREARHVSPVRARPRWLARTSTPRTTRSAVALVSSIVSATTSTGARVEEGRCAPWRTMSSPVRCGGPWCRPHGAGRDPVIRSAYQGACTAVSLDGRAAAAAQRLGGGLSHTPRGCAQAV